MESFAAKVSRIKAASDKVDAAGWRLDGLILKSNGRTVSQSVVK